MSENNVAVEMMEHKEKSRKKMLIGFFIAVGAIGAVSATYWYLYRSNFVSTDNAYAAVETAQVSSAVGGIVSEVCVTDTQTVHQGDVLVRIDPTDAKLAVAQARADLQRAIRKVKGFQANDKSLSAQIDARKADEIHALAQMDAAKSDFERAQTDLKRRKSLATSGAVSGDELTKAQNAYETAKAAYEAAQAALEQTRANFKTALGSKEANTVLISEPNLEENPEVVFAKARLDQALVDLNRTVITAPEEGIVAKRIVQLGQRVQIGMLLLSIVPIQNMHVDANYKEVQLEKVKVGQPVVLHADIYGKSVTYHGSVEGFSGGSGAAFSAIPAQNATGNWIKVVQRLPVRIKLNPEELKVHPLKVGLSMDAEIDTRTSK